MQHVRYILISLFIFIFSISAFADVWSTSKITSNTTWTKNNASGDGVWIVDVPNDSLIIDTGATLTIEPGVTVKFHDDVLFLVKGAIIAEGTSQDSIIFTLDDAPGSATEWSGIKLLSDSVTVNKLIYCRIEYGDADISFNMNNSYEGNGGGIFCGADISQNTIIQHCTIQNNKAREGGGGIFIEGKPKIEYNLIRYNNAGQFGGGIGIRGSSVLDFANPSGGNNIIIHNRADGQGGGGIGVFANANGSFINDLIYDNHSLNGSGGGIFLYSSTSFLTMKNAIIWENSANSDNQIFGVVNLTYSDVEGGYSGTGNINSDPQFNNSANDDFHFEATSAVVDAGTNDGISPVDFDGNSRPFDGDRNGDAVADMGPFEYQNTPPHITSTPITNATEDQEYTYQVMAEDPDAGETLTYSLLQAPSFLSIDAQTGLISGTATTNEQAGDYTVSVQVADLNNATDTQSYTLTVSPVNDAPVVSDIPDQTINEGQTFNPINLDDYVSDEDNSPSEMTWTYSGNQDLQVSIDGNHVATISIPDTNWYGSEAITFTATDPGGLSDGHTVVFTVNNVNDAPVVSDIPDQTIEEGQNFATINLNDYVDDIDNDDSEINWTYSGNQDLSVSIDENNIATITPPDENWNGSETITFTATDSGGLSDNDAAIFTINPVNDAPIVSDIPDQSIDEGGSFVSIHLDNYVNDVDNSDSELTWTYSGNKDLQVIISADHIATVSAPDTNWFGAETITFTATDPSGLSDSDRATFTVNNINDAPQAIDDTASTNEDTPINILVLNNDSDIDGDTLIISEVSQPAHGTATIDQNTQIIFTPAENWSGNDSFTYTISDGNGGTAQASVQVSVNAVNDAPVVSDIPDQTIDEGQTFISVNLNNYVSDVDNTSNEMTWSYSGNKELQVTIDASNIATVTIPDSNWFGSETITFTATDPGGLSNSDQAVFTVNNVDDPPVVSAIPGQTIDEGGTFSAISLDDYVTDIDNADDEINWTAKGNKYLSIEINNNVATISTPDSNWYGSDTLIFTATDPAGLADSTITVFIVNSVNDAPIISDIPNQSVNEGEDFSDIYLDNYVTDVDDPDSVLSWSFSGNKQLDIEIIDNRVMHIRPKDANWNGSETILFTVQDPHGATDQDSATFTVLPVNDPPIAINDTIYVSEDSVVTFDVLANDTDAENDNLVISTFEVPNHGKISLQDSLFTYQPDSNWFGIDSLQYVASDGNGGLDTAIVFIWIKAVDDAPVILPIADQIIQEGQTFPPIPLDNYVNDVDDADSLLTWIYKGNVELNVAINSERILLVNPPTEDWNGSELISLVVSDTSGLMDSIQVRFTVSGVNDTVQIKTPLPTLVFNEDDSLNYLINNWYPFVDDKDNADSSLSFSLSGGKVISFYKTDSSFVFKAPANFFGNDTLQLTVTDGQAPNSAALYVTVNPINDPPEIHDLPDEINFDNDSTYVLTLKNYATDIDTPDSLLSWTFIVSNDSLKLNYDVVSTQLTLSAPDFSGKVQLICTVSDDSGATAQDTILVQVSPATGIENAMNSYLPKKFELYQNFPNPFNPTTTIKFAMPKAGHVKIVVYNILGKMVATILDEDKTAGYHKVVFDGSSLASGIYFYQLQTKEFRKVKKFILLK